MRKRTIPIALAVLLIAIAIAVAVWLRGRAAPEPARLLPAADGFVYINLKPLRRAGVISATPPVTREPEYENFVRETGFQFERDLDEAAFAVHPPNAAQSARSDTQNRYSEVFIGHFDTARAVAYFHKLSSAMERYREVDIFSIPLEGRTVRVALIGVDIVAVSNTEGPEVIHGIIDRYKQAAMPFGGPALLREYYRRVPFASVAWAVVRMTAPNQGNRALLLPGRLNLFFPNGTVLVASVRYTGSVQLRSEAFTANEEQAQRITDQANAFLALFKNLETAAQPSGPDHDVKAFFDSFKVDHEKNRAVLTATVPPGFVKKLFSEPLEAPSALQPPLPPPEKKPAPKHKGKRRH